MAIPTSIQDLSPTDALNSPAGSDAVGGQIDDFLRSHAGIIRRALSSGTTIAAASTINLPPEGTYFAISGSTTVNLITGGHPGRVVWLHFTSSLGKLATNSSIITGGAATINSDGNYIFQLINISGNVWRVVSVERDIRNLIAGLSTIVTGATGDIATINSTLGTVTADISAITSRSIIAGSGLTGGGTLALSRTITMGTPGTLTNATTNGVTSTSHTHAVDTGSTTVTGLVRLATVAEAETGTIETAGATPAGVTAAIRHSSNAATTVARGNVELATNAETETGSDTTRATTPAGVTAAIRHLSNAATTSARGNIELATDLESSALADTERAVTPSGLGAALLGASGQATTTSRGTVELATSAEIQTGSDNVRAVTPMGMRDAQQGGAIFKSISIPHATLTNVSWTGTAFSYNRGLTIVSGDIRLPTNGLWAVQFGITGATNATRLNASLYATADLGSILWRTGNEGKFGSSGFTDSGYASLFLNISDTSLTARTLRLIVYQENAGSTTMSGITVSIGAYRIGPAI